MENETIDLENLTYQDIFKILAQKFWYKFTRELLSKLKKINNEL